MLAHRLVLRDHDRGLPARLKPRDPVFRSGPSDRVVPQIQKKIGCACGGGCPRRQQHPLHPDIQTKLAISTPGDQYEQEADRVAEQVMQMSAPHDATRGSAPAHHLNPLLQRKCEACEDEQQGAARPEEETLQPKELTGRVPHITPEVQSQINQLRSGGQPLPQHVRAFFEPRFGHDFSQVRIHADGPAVESARKVSALAYTVGQDIVLGAGQTSYETPGGMRLLAHELTHVMQQGGGQSLSGHSSLARVSYRVSRMIQRINDAGFEANTGVGRAITSGTMVPDNSIMGQTFAASNCRGLYGCNINFEFGKAYKGDFPSAPHGSDLRGVYTKISASFNSSVCGTCGTVDLIQDFRYIAQGTSGMETAEPTTEERKKRAGWGIASAPSRGWGIDPGVGLTKPFVTDSWQANPGTSKIPATSWDAPGHWTNVMNHGKEFQICAVCDRAGVKRRVLACVNWGYYTDSAGAVSFRPAVPVATCGPTQELQDATTRWESIAGNLPGNIDFSGETPVDQRRQLSVLWFQSNSTVLRQDAEIDSASLMADALLRVRQHLAVGPNARIVVHGYASEWGDEDHKLHLSRRRAEIIQARLIEAGIPENRISIEAHGEDRTMRTHAFKRGVEIEYTVAVAAGAPP